MFLRNRETIHDQLLARIVLFAPRALQQLVTGNGLNIAQSVAVVLMTTLSVSFTAMVKRCVAS